MFGGVVLFTDAVLICPKLSCEDTPVQRQMNESKSECVFGRAHGRGKAIPETHGGKASVFVFGGVVLFTDAVFIGPMLSCEDTSVGRYMNESKSESVFGRVVLFTNDVSPW